MPYVGRGLDRGNYLKLDNISSSFNNTLTTFNLTAGNQAFFPGSAFSILVVLAGVVQEPEAAYSINQSQIIFASAPLAGDQFFCISLGVPLGINVPGNGTVDGAQLAKPFNYDGYFYLDDANNRVGVGTATPQKPLHVIGEGQFDSVRILGDLTIDGTTTTLDTVVTEVDKLEVGANNSTVGVAITQSGSGDILNLYDGSTEVFSVADGGDVSIVDKIIHTGDTNTAIRFPADDTVTVETGGTERLRVTSAGNVGIGTADPQRKLSIKDSGNTFISIENLSNVTSGLIGANSSGLTLISRDTQGGSTAKPIQFITGSTEKVRISSTGLVGIGTADPQSQFEVFGSSPVVRSKNTTNQTYTEISNDGTDGYVDWSSGDLVFRSASNTERLRIKTGGNIGIGTDNPSKKLDVNGDIRAVGTTPQLIVGDTFSNTRFIFGYDQSRAGHNLGSKILADGLNIGYYTRLDQNGSHIFYTNNSGSDAERLRIKSDGSVGIGTDNPQGIFHIESTAPQIRLEDSDHVAHALINAEGGNLRFDTDNGNEEANSVTSFRIDGSEKLRITSAGLVGIKNTSPNNTLTVGDGVQTSYAPSTAGNYLEIARTSGADAGLLINKNTGQWLVGIDNSDGANAPLRFEYGAAGSAHPGFGAGTLGMIIKHDGKVGINEATPDSKLDILYSSSTNPATENLIHLRTDPGAGYVTRGLFVKIGRDGPYDNSGAHYDIVGSAGNSGFHAFEVQGDEKLRITKDGKIGVNDATPSVSLDLASNTDAVSLPTGTTAQRPSGTDAYIRKNSTNNALEFYNGTNWVEIITDYFPTGSTTLG